MASPPLNFPDTSAVQTRLPNGLDIIIKEDHSAEVVSVQAWCSAGSIHEDEWSGAGLSHILEHMLFKGTKKRQGPEISTQVQDVGGYINAYTSFDRTVYWIDAPSSGTELCLDVLLDVTTEATLPEDEYEKEQEVIRREFAMGFDDPGRMSSQLLFATAFQHHPYRHPVIGHLDVFNTLTRADVLAYYKRHYVPNNMLFVVVGAVDSAKVTEQIARYFDDYPRQPYTPVVIPEEPAQLGRREAHVEFETQLTKMHLAWHIPGVSHPDMPALDVLASILGQGRSSRFYRTIREERELAHSIGAYAYTPAHGGLFSASATVEPDKRTAVEAAIHEVIGDLASGGVREDELEKAKKSCLVDMLGELTSMRGQANDLATNWMLSRNLDFTRDYLTDIHAVTGDQVCDVVCRYLLDSNLSSVSLNPKGFLQVAASEENEDCSAETRRFQLDNGLTVLLQEDHRVPLVSLRVSFLAGLLGEDEKTSGLAQLASRCLLKGTSTRSAAEIADAIENSGGTLAASAGNNTFTVAAGCLEQDLVMALDLMSDVLLRPTFPKGEIEREKVAQLASIRSESDHLVTVAVRRLRSELFGDHPYANARVGSEDSVAQLSHLEAEDFQNRYIAADNGVLAVFGAVDSEKTEKLIRDVFEAMPVGERAFAEVLPPPALAKSKVIDLSTDKQQAVLVTGFPGAALDSPDRLALELIEEACSDMSSRLFMRIREEMGLAYYVSASQMFGLAPGVFYFYVGTDPDKLDDVQSALADEVAKLAEGGLEPQEYARAKKTLLGKAAMGAQGAGARAAVQSLDELYGFGYDYSKSLEERVEAISLEDVNRVLRKFFHEKPAITLRVSPNL